MFIQILNQYREICHLKVVDSDGKNIQSLLRRVTKLKISRKYFDFFFFFEFMSEVLSIAVLRFVRKSISLTSLVAYNSINFS